MINVGLWLNLARNKVWGYKSIMAKEKHKLKNNSGDLNKRVMVQCRTAVKRDAVRRQSIDGVEHIIVSSSTLPDDIVMNGGLYPADEIARSFESLELTLAPVEHPHIDGQFISANNPLAIHNFHAGAFNMNARRENGRVHIDKYINVAQAMTTDRGKRLLDRIEEIETNENARPIHTSVGVFVFPEELSEPKTNSAGDEYTWVARDLVFDHDAILLDSVGAAQPHQGVGVAVNAEGDEFDVQLAEVMQEPEQEKESKSFTDVGKAVNDALDNSAISADYIEELYDDRVIFRSGESLFEVPYVIDNNGIATIVGIPMPVDRNVTFTAKTNHSEGNAMKDLILNALKDAGIETDSLSDGQILEAYNQLQANQSEGDDTGASDDKGLAEVVANAVSQANAPLAQKIEGLQAKLNSAGQAELDRLAELVGNSEKFPGLSVEDAKKLGVNSLKSMAANCATAFGVSPIFNNSAGVGEQLQAPSEMPE